jgi:hypothetical protein
MVNTELGRMTGERDERGRVDSKMLMNHLHVIDVINAFAS